MAELWLQGVSSFAHHHRGSKLSALPAFVWVESVGLQGRHQGLCKLTSEAAGSQALRSPAPWCAQMHSSARPHHMHTAISRSITSTVAMATGCQLPRSWPLWNHTAHPSQVISLFHGSQPGGMGGMG